MPAQKRLADSLGTVLPGLGLILQRLSGEGTGRSVGITFRDLLVQMPGNPEDQEAGLLGALAILRSMGLICIDAGDRVKGASRYACFAMGSLSKFLTASVPVANGRVDDMERYYLVTLTHALESVRVQTIDRQPLHARRIVNVLIKSRQIRNYSPVDVYLHVLHPQWKEYHLIGLSHKDDSRTDEEIALRALEKQVGLVPDQYTLDPLFNPSIVTDARISATSGAYTEYTYCLRAVKDIKVKIDLQRLTKENGTNRDQFRWFTWEEMKQRRSQLGEPIMFSRATVMEKSELTAIPIDAVQVAGPRYPDDRFHLRRYLSSRVSKRFLGCVAVSLLLIAALLVAVPRVIPLLGHTSPLLDNLGSVSDICSLIIALLGALAGLSAHRLK